MKEDLYMLMDTLSRIVDKDERRVELIKLASKLSETMTPSDIESHLGDEVLHELMEAAWLYATTRELNNLVKS